jgi:hypothetical protein
MLPYRLEQWNSAFEAYDNAISILKTQQPPDDKLRGEVQLSYSEAKKRAKHVRELGAIPNLPLRPRSDLTHSFILFASW